MTIEKNKNGYLIYEIVNGELYKKQFIFYTKAKAVRQFKNEVKQIKK